MSTFDPPMSERDTEDLVAIAHGTTENWQREAIDQAREELIKRGITDEHQQRILARWEKQEKRVEQEYAKWLSDNATESYALAEKAFIFAIAPFIILAPWKFSSGPSLRVLKEQDYQRKFAQRRILLWSGTLSWIFLIIIYDMLN